MKGKVFILLGFSFLFLSLSVLEGNAQVNQQVQKNVPIVLTDDKSEDLSTNGSPHNDYDHDPKERGDPKESTLLTEIRKKVGIKYTRYPQTNEIHSFLISFVGTWVLLIAFYLFFKRRKDVEDEN